MHKDEKAATAFENALSKGGNPVKLANHQVVNHLLHEWQQG